MWIAWLSKRITERDSNTQPYLKRLGVFVCLTLGDTMKKLLVTLLLVLLPFTVNAEPIQLYCMAAYQDGCQYMNTVMSWQRWISAMGHDGQRYEIVSIEPTRTPGSNAAFVYIAPKQEAKQQTMQSESRWAKDCRKRGRRYDPATDLCL